ncbi:MAG: hypothetical protein ACRDYZ_07005 [Acidimicrobiales bacterium]
MASNGPSAASDLLAQAVLPRDTGALGVPPTGFIANEPVPITPGADEFDAHGIFSVAVAPSALVAYVRRHLRRSWSVGGPQFGPPPGGATLLVRLPGRGAHFEEGSLSYEAVPTRTGADVRVDAMVVWKPSRPSDESVPAVGQVVVTGYAASSLSRGSTGPTTVSVTGSAARRVRRDFDALALAAPGSCMESENVYALQFTGRVGLPEVSVGAGTCPSPGEVSVTSDGSQMAPLLEDCRLLRAVAAVLPPHEAAYTHRRAAACRSSALAGELP